MIHTSIDDLDVWPNQSPEPTRSAPLVSRLSVRIRYVTVRARLSFGR